MHTIGDILMIVGVLGLIIWLIVWAPWARSRRTPYPPPRTRMEAEEDRMAAYRANDPAYRADDRYGPY